MAEPTTATTTTALISAFSITAIFPGLDAGSVIGALCGATLLIVGKKELTRSKSIILFFVSFLMGILFADLMTTTLHGIFSEELSNKTPSSLGPLLVSALATQLLLLILNQDLASIVRILRGRV